MTIAEIVLLGAAGVGIYVLLRPLQRWLETILLQALTPPGGRRRRQIIDVTEFTSHQLPKRKDDD
jgi:hypothetical protein